jgi:hypothetical protein
MPFAKLDYAHYFQSRLSHTLRVSIDTLGKRKTNNQDKRNQNEKPCYHSHANLHSRRPEAGWQKDRAGVAPAFRLVYIHAIVTP